MKSTILISGTTGFVGKHLKEYFNSKRSNEKVLSLNRLKNHDESITWTQIKEGFIPDVKAYIHLTGKAHDTKNTTNEKAYFDVNTDLTIQLFQNFLLSNAKYFLYVSSVKAVADQVDGILTEDVVPNPQTAYGKSKLAAENAILELYSNYLKQHPTSNKKMYILRPCMIHGPGNKGNLNLLVNFANKGIPYPLASFQNKRSFLSIKNMIFLIDQIIERDISVGIYNLSDDLALSTNELIDLIAEINHKKIFKLYIPKFLIRFLFKIFDIFHLPIGTEQLNKLVENYQVSNAKILKELGLKLPVNSRDGLKVTIQSFNN